MERQLANKSLLLPSQSPAPVSTLFVPSWHLAIDPDQEDKIVVNGTIQQIDAYMEAHYPGRSAKLANFTYSHSAPAKRAPISDVSEFGRPAGVMGLHVGVNLLDSSIHNYFVFLTWLDG
ncbi:hypothetical protein E4U13_001212 [Claviceps humidiphila]|uniref:Uncharacterized protein n=1 Tax=Claviceps humidiphila TaxID=1294629 RepID=A0A9P7TVD9_9HYPO|nr:hypothetical protein E4U13_001212 [Claviceps humidiphila]